MENLTYTMVEINEMFEGLFDGYRRNSKLKKYVTLSNKELFGFFDETSRKQILADYISLISGRQSNSIKAHRDFIKFVMRTERCSYCAVLLKPKVFAYGRMAWIDSTGSGSCNNVFRLHTPVENDSDYYKYVGIEVK